MKSLDSDIRRHSISCVTHIYACKQTFFFAQAVRILQALEHPVPYKLLATAAFMTPFQGFFNFLAFIFPRYFVAKENNPQGGVLEWVKAAL